MWPDWLATTKGVRAEEQLARHSQFGIGGPADLFLKVDDLELLTELVPRCAADRVPLTVLGAGSNALIGDGGVRGLTIKVAAKGWQQQDGSVTLEAGTMMPRVALDLARVGLTGLEWGIGVPGTCGASIWGNAGAFGGDVSGTLEECQVMSPQGVTRWLSAERCGFGYRDSVFKGAKRDHVILRGRFGVRPEDAAVVRARTDAVQADRKATQPYGVRSLGSTFKNPVGDFAGRLIEAAGLKGRRYGGAQISPKHANFILNVGAASAHDVLELIELAHARVAVTAGVDLEREIAVLGEPAPQRAGARSGT